MKPDGMARVSRASPPSRRVAWNVHVDSERCSDAVATTGGNPP